MQDVGCPVGQQGVALHLAQSDAAAKLAALDRLLGQLVVGTGRADLDILNGGEGRKVRLEAGWLWGPGYKGERGREGTQQL